MSYVFPLSVKAEVRADLADFVGTCKNTEEMERTYFRLGAGGGLGRRPEDSVLM